MNANFVPHSLPKSYVDPHHYPSFRSISYSQPQQKTAQLWNKSKDDLASQLTDLKSYVAHRPKD